MVFWILLAAAVIGIIIYTAFDPESALFPKCPIYALTGLQCPGCGSQRALHHLMHFEFLEAVRDNILFVLSLPLLAAFAATFLFREELPKAYKALHSRAFVIIFLSLTAVWTILRNVF